MPFLDDFYLSHGRFIFSRQGTQQHVGLFGRYFATSYHIQYFCLFSLKKTHVTHSFRAGGNAGETAVACQYWVNQNLGNWVME
jgi:hypothetical protein